MVRRCGTFQVCLRFIVATLASFVRTTLGVGPAGCRQRPGCVRVTHFFFDLIQARIPPTRQFLESCLRSRRSISGRTRFLKTSRPRSTFRTKAAASDSCSLLCPMSHSTSCPSTIRFSCRSGSESWYEQACIVTNQTLRFLVVESVATVFSSYSSVACRTGLMMSSGETIFGAAPCWRN